jgi:hypothetical protein
VTVLKCLAERWRETEDNTSGLLWENLVAFG